jgi:exopolyphosphatase/guanosine-5'-triphosphate,3'-diphosphate pyrophosphatase
VSKLAIIDVGSNSVRYAEERFGALSDKSVFTTRLGSGLSATGMLREDTMANSIAVISLLADKARAGGFTPMAYATSAVRDASNGREFAERVYKECGVPVDILTGEQEARYAFLGAVGEEGRFDAMLDIGGASMQVVTESFGVSFRAGCVRCGDIARAATGAEDCDTLREAQRSAVTEYMDGEVRLPKLTVSSLVGVGGSITTLAALKAGLREFSAEVVDNVVLTKDDIESLISVIGEMGERRKKHPLLTERHDVILYGAYILSHALDLIGTDRLGISCADGMEGYFRVLKDE